MPDTEVVATSSHRKIVEFFNAEYRWWDEVYDATFPRRFFSFEMIRRRELLVELLDRYAPEDGQPRVLECGCGPGGIIRQLNRPRWQLTAIDINTRHLVKARSDVGAAVNWLQADIEHLPFRDQAFDLVYCAGVLSYLPDDAAAIAEIARVVKPGGAVCIAQPNWLMLNKLFDPYYFVAWLPARLATRCFPRRADVKFGTAMIRRYRCGQFLARCRCYGLVLQEQVSVSYGPLTFWRREFLPLRFSLRLSEALNELDKRKGFSILQHCTNHWIVCLSKPCL